MPANGDATSSIEAHQRPSRLFDVSRASDGWLIAIVFAVSVLLALVDPVVGWLVSDGQAAPPNTLGVLALIVVGTAVQCAALVWVRRAPVAVVLATYAVYLVMAVALDAPNWVSSSQLATGAALFVLASGSNVKRTLATSAALLVACLVVLGLWAGQAGVEGTAMSAWLLSSAGELLVRCGLPTILGVWWGGQARRAAAATAEAETARREHEVRVARAKEGERRRLARELHDLAAHHLSGVLALADAAADIGQDDPVRAVALIEEIRAEGRFAAASMYGAMGELRTSTSPDQVTHSLRDLVELIDREKARGRSVGFFTLGELEQLPAVVSMTAFRVIQESLTNAARHAPGGAVRVRVVAEPARLTVTVVNEPATAASEKTAGSSGGWGLSGMKERLGLLDGVLTSGRTDTGGWRNRAIIPLSARASDDEPLAAGQVIR